MKRKIQNQACVSTESGLITIGGTKNYDGKAIPILTVFILREEVWQTIGKLNEPSIKNAAMMVGNDIFVTSGRYYYNKLYHYYMTTERLKWNGKNLTSTLLSFDDGLNFSPILFQVPIDFCS